MQEAEDYAASARGFLRKAQVELAAGDLVQACEKGWGAAAQTLKAVASALHINFYEDRFSRHMVESGLRGVDELVARLQRYLPS